MIQTNVRPHDPLALFLVGGLCLLGFKGLLALLTLVTLYPSIGIVSIVPIFLSCALVARGRRPELSPALLTLCKGVAVACGTYSLLHYPDMPVAHEKLAGLGGWLLWMGWAAAAVAALLALRHPVWLLFCGFYMYWVKDIAGYLTGFLHHTHLDILPLYQAGGFLGASMLVVQGLARMPVRSWGRLKEIDPSMAILFIAVAMQAANYFVASLAKLRLDGGPLDWVLHNQNADILAVALFNKQLLWGDSALLVGAATTFFGTVGQPIAVAIVLFQFCSLIIFSHKRILLLVFLFLDLMHLGIFLLAGANFWTWFMLNIAIMAAMSRLPAASFNWRTGLIGMALVALLPLVAWVVWLGWYDTRAVNSVYFEVEEESGMRVRVPSTFFGFYSYPIAHMSFGLPPGNYLPTLTNGGTLSSQVRKESIACEFSTHHSALEKVWNPSATSRFVQDYHRHVLEKVGSDGHWSNVWYPHHFWSAPSMERQFAQVDLRQVRRYILTIESVCVDRAGRIEKSLHRNEFPIDVTSP